MSLIQLPFIAADSEDEAVSQIVSVTNSALGIIQSEMNKKASPNLSGQTIDNTNSVKLKDSKFTLQDDADVTRQMQFELSPIATGTKRILTVPNASMTLAGREFDNGFTATQTISAGTGTKVVGPSGSTAYSLTDQATNNGGKKWRYGHTGGVAGFTSWDVVNETDSVVALTLSATGNAAVAGSVAERGRTAAMGEWTNVAYAAGNFTAVGGGSWTVDAGDVPALMYSLVGKTLNFVGNLQTTTVAGTCSELRVALPASATIGSLDIFLPIASYNGAAWSVGTVYARLTSGATYLRIMRADGANMTTGVDNQYFNFNITIPIL